MWCRHCQQEAPAIGPITSYGARCPRCNRAERAPEERETESRMNSSSDALPFGSDGMARRQIQRSLQSAQSAAAAGAASNTFRFDLGTLGIPAPFSASDTSATYTTTSESNSTMPRKSITALRQSRKQPMKKSSGVGQVLGWGVANCGAMLLGLGIGLIIWATYGGRTLLWGPAIATTIAGQGLMIVGLLQLLANLWSAARHTSAKLTQIHDDLRRVRRTTEESAGRQHATATGFYAELSGGATSEVLLGNLRGQLDQLSARLRIDQ